MIEAAAQAPAPFDATAGAIRETRETAMTDAKSVSDHWASDDVFARISAAMRSAGLTPESTTVESLAPVDQLHARGLAATVELADALPVQASDHLVDIGCGVGGPARYFAKRFGCRVSGIDITAPFVDAARKLTALVHLEDQVDVRLGDGRRLPFGDASFDGGYAQHVTMNVADRGQFFGEAYRVLKPGAFFALSEHGLGPKGDLHFPVPWSDDGSGSHLLTPAETVAALTRAGFAEVVVTDTGPAYLAGYHRALELRAKGPPPALGVHVLLGEQAAVKAANAARNIEEGRTHPIQVICRKPG